MSSLPLVRRPLCWRAAVGVTPAGHRASELKSSPLVSFPLTERAPLKTEVENGNSLLSVIPIPGLRTPHTDICTGTKEMGPRLARKIKIN